MQEPPRTTQPAVEVSWSQALAWRMKRQFLLNRAPADDLIAVSDRMCALHAQVMSSVELALWARIDGLDQTAVRDALWQHRSLVKLWAMRRTLHVVPSFRLGTWLGGLATYRDGPDFYQLRDPKQLELAELVGRVLHGKLLTRTELADEVARLSGAAAIAETLLGSWGGNLKPASFLGQLCFGPNEGHLVRFTHPDTWLDTPPKRYAGDEALVTIARKYLNVYGPAVPADLGSWWGVSRTAAAQLIAALGDATTLISVDGEPHWMLTEQVADLASTRPASPVVRLLPGFDPWVVCASRLVRSRGSGEPTALDPAYRTRIYRLQGWVSPVLLIDGRIAGVWRHERRGRRLRVDVEPFAAIPRWTRQPIENEAERLAAFLGGELQLTVS